MLAVVAPLLLSTSALVGRRALLSTGAAAAISSSTIAISVARYRHPSFANPLLEGFANPLLEGRLARPAEV